MEERIEREWKAARRQELEQAERLDKMAAAAKTLLEEMGEDPSRDGLMDTPMRMAKAMTFFSKGYKESLEDIVGGALFEVEDECDGMVMMRDIDVWSLCEHHAIPFFGKCHIAYLPHGKVLGLSKLARICEMYSRRLQVQERLTQQIAEAVHKVTRGRGCGVVLECTHMCVNMRGVQKNRSITTTSYMLGEFRENNKTREEFLQLALK